MIMRAQPYSGVLVRASRRPVLNVMRRTRGLGNGCMSGQDFSALIGPSTNCDPHDSACVMCNTQRGNAVSNLVDSGCVAPGTPVSFSCDTSNTALAAFMNNTPIAVNATVGTGSSAYVATGPAVTNSACPGCSAAELAYFGLPAYVQATQQQQSNPTAQQTVITQTTPPYKPLPPPPGSSQIVNPTPGSQSTSTGSSATSPNSTNSQANGGWFTDSTQDVITGLPNWALIAMGGGALLLVMEMMRRR